MKLMKLVVFWLSASACRAEMISKQASKSNNLANLEEFMVKIVSSCYEKEVEIVGLAGSSHDALLGTLSSKLTLPVALTGSDMDNTLEDRNSRYKLQLFVVSASSPKGLEQILRQIKISHWWNHMGTYFILDRNNAGPEGGCSNAFRFLWTAWQKDLLKAFYVCINRTRGRLIYTYNPYTSKAPEPWQLTNTYKGKNDHPWSLFQREYDDDERICENLDFDKTTDLGGYELYSTAKELPGVWETYVNESGTNKFGGYAGRFASAVLHALNANARLKLHDVKNSGLSDSLGRDIAVDTTIGISDLLLIPRFHSIVNNYTVSYGFRESEIAIMTQHSGEQTQLEKLITVLDRSSRICVCVVAVTIAIFFKCFLRQSFGSAILNVLRIAVSSNLTKVPDNQAARIYLAGIFILVVTIIGIYQGQLSSLLTKPKPLPNVESMKDLADSGYTVHSFKVYAHLFTDPAFEGRYMQHDDFNCSQFVLQNPLAACVQPRIDLIGPASKFNLHLSRDTILTSFYTYVIREDWPLEERLNFVLAALTEADVPRLTLEEEIERILKIDKYNDDVAEINKFKVIRLSQLSFAFALLAIGLTCASVCFVVEVVVWKLRQID